MGRHSAQRMRSSDLRHAYPRLLDAYGRLLGDHRRLESDYAGLLEQPSAAVEVWTPPERPAVWGRPGDAMDPDTACALVRGAGLLITPGLGT